MTELEKIYRTRHIMCPSRYSGVTVQTRERVEGDLLVSPDGNYYIGKYVGAHSLTVGGRLNHRVRGMQHLGLYLVEPTSIRQCTCVPDKADSLIFEGDILQYTPSTSVSILIPGLSTERKFYVYYDTDTLTWMVEATDESNAQFPLYKLNKNAIKVLGHTVPNIRSDTSNSNYTVITDYVEVKVTND